MEEMFVARIPGGRLFLYVGKPPIKNDKEKAWDYSVFFTECMELDERLFPEVKWSDEEPTKVKLEIVKQ